MIVSRRAIVAAALASLPVRAFPQAAKVSRIGLVTIGALESTVLDPAMAKEFAKLGYIEGKNVEFERRAAQGKSDRLAGFIDDLVAKHVDVIVTASYPAAAAAKERAGTTPVVVTFSGDRFGGEPCPSARHHYRRFRDRGGAFGQASSGPEGGGAERARRGGFVERR